MANRIPGWRPEHARKLHDLLAQHYGTRTVRGLAPHVWLSPGHLSEILSGRRGVTYETMEKFAKALGIGTQDLLGRVGWRQAEDFSIPPPAALDEGRAEMLVRAIAAMTPAELEKYRSVFTAFLLIAGKVDPLLARGIASVFASPSEAAAYVREASEENLVLAYHALLFLTDPAEYAAAGNLTLRPIRALSVPERIEQKLKQQFGEK